MDSGAVDDLFKLPLEQFTAARNVLAGSLKKGGNRTEAERVKTLPRPPLSAWAVNQLYWRQRKPFKRFLDSAARFRKAQTLQLSGKRADLRGSLSARREALSELSTLAASVLKQSGHAPTSDAMRRVTTTLEALASREPSANGPAAGRLTHDLDSPGFETLAALVPQHGRTRGGTSSRVLPFQHKRASSGAAKKPRNPVQDERRRAAQHRAAVAAATRAVQRTERALDNARNVTKRAELALRQAARRAKVSEKAKVAAEQLFEKRAAASDAARLHARRVAAKAEEAAQAVDDAERALADARLTLRGLRPI